MGLEWNTKNMTVQPSKEKQNKILNSLYKLKLQKWCTLRELESLIGKLSHCAVLMWPGKDFLRRMRDILYIYTNKYGRKEIIIILPNWVLKDITWWIQYMLQLEPLSIINECEMRREDTIMAFDGATNGSREKG